MGNSIRSKASVKVKNDFKKHLHILYPDKDNQNIFKKIFFISADRKRKNLGQIYKPSVPRRNIEFGPKQERGFFPCTNKCDTCAHSKVTKNIKSPWDWRNWQILQHITCATPFVVYFIYCTIYCTIHNVFYTGSTVNLKLRWANHKSDINLQKSTKCRLAQYVTQFPHPCSKQFEYLDTLAVESVSNDEELLEKELYWQSNFGSLIDQHGLNFRKHLKKSLKYRIQF